LPPLEITKIIIVANEVGSMERITSPQQSW